MSNLSKIQEFFAAYASKNVATVRSVMADDIVWRIPGHHPLAGEKRGITEVLAFFDKLGKASFQNVGPISAANRTHGPRHETRTYTAIDLGDTLKTGPICRSD